MPGAKALRVGLQHKEVAAAAAQPAARRKTQERGLMLRRTLMTADEGINQ